MLWLATTLKLIAEVALMAMLGQWFLGHLPGVVPGVNPFWRLLDWVSAPFVRLAARWPAPATDAAQARQRAAWLLLLLWCAAVVLKISVCLGMGARACR